MNDQQNQGLTTYQPAQTSIFQVAPGAGFAAALEVAKYLTDSDLVPFAYRGKPANGLIALEYAQRFGVSPLMIMQNTNIISGKPSFSASFIIGLINNSRRFSPIEFVFGESGTTKVKTLNDQTLTTPLDVPNKTCYAVSTDLKSGKQLKSPTITIKAAVREGWFGKKGSKWPSMPDLMLSYRAATSWGRLYAGEIIAGMQTTEELQDIEATVVASAPLRSNGPQAPAQPQGGGGIAGLTARIEANAGAPQASSDTIQDAEVVGDDADQPEGANGAQASSQGAPAAQAEGKKERKPRTPKTPTVDRADQEPAAASAAPAQAATPAAQPTAGGEYPGAIEPDETDGGADQDGDGDETPAADDADLDAAEGDGKPKGDGDVDFF